MQNRREFMRSIAAASAIGVVGCAVPPPKPLFRISLAEWSLNRALFRGEIDHLDFPDIAKQEFDINAVEYVNQFFMDKAEDKNYLNEMKQRCEDAGVKSLLIMCDNEGRIGDPDEAVRRQTVENHYKWVTAARELGCHAIRVNAYSQGSDEEQQNLVADGLLQLCEYAHDYEIDVLVENHGGLSSNGQWLAGVMKKVDHIRIGTLPDFGNFQLAHDEWYDRYKGVAELMPFAKAVSAKTGEFDANGHDIRTDYFRMMKIVIDAGYRGYVGIESGCPRCNEMEAIAKTKALLERTRDALLAERAL